MQMEKKKFYQTKWFLWLWLIFFPPVGIVLLWACHKEMKKVSRIVLSVVFAIWVIILMAATQGGSTDTPTTDPTPSQSSSSAVGESSTPPEDSSSSQAPNDMPREISVQDAEDACNSYFTEIVTKAYGEVPWGEGTENGIVIEPDYNVENQSGTVVITYTLMDEPNTGTPIAITFTLEGERVSVSEIIVAGEKAEMPDEAKEIVLIWLLLDVNYKG